jgi:hypothetical protein
MDIKVNEENINMIVETYPTIVETHPTIVEKIAVNNGMLDSKKIEELEKIQEKIEKMSVFNQIEILKIFHEYKDEVTLNENKNGILINLTDVPSYIITKIYEYISYVEKQEKQLSTVETQKDEIMNSYFN